MYMNLKRTMQILSMQIVFTLGVIISQATANDCKTLTPAQCAHSKRCIIDCEMKPRAGSLKCDGRYFCREPEGKCEENWKPNYSAPGGKGNLQADCEKTSGCIFDFHECVCPCDFKLPEEPQCMCACGGGAPATCKKG
jgi:hypothetical protein